MESDAVLTETVFSEAYGKFYGKTVRYLQSLNMSYEQAEEIAQAAWVRGWEKRNQLKKLDSVGAWINGIAKNLMRVDWQRTRPFLHGIAVGVDDIEEMMVLSYDPTDLMEIHGDLQVILSMLSAEDRLLLVESYMMEYTSLELAPAYGLDPVSVRVRLLRIKNDIRKNNIHLLA